MMRNRRQVFVILVGVLLFALLLLAGGRGGKTIILAQDGDAAAYLPLVLSEFLSPTPTVTISATATSTPTATATSTATATATLEPSATATDTPTPTEEPTATPTETATASPTATIPPGGSVSYFPLIAGPPPLVLQVPLRVSKEPPIDFAAERAEAQAKGLDLAFNKIGFHVLQGNNRAGLSDYIKALDAAGVPVVLKGASDAQYLFEAQELGKISGVEHVLVYRDAAKVGDPNFDIDPITAARQNWAQNRAVFPPELDPTLVWMETTNEPRDKPAVWVEWMAEFALEQAKLAVRDNVRYAAFSWTTGAPPGEEADWESPAMLAFLRYAAQHPDLIAVALHEYSLVEEDIGRDYPFFVGRFQKLFNAADRNGIPRPNVFITEWGWEYNNAPDTEQAMKDIEWAAWLYAAYPQVKGVAIWTLGKGEQFGSIGDQVRQYFGPLQAYSLSNYFLYSPGTRPIDEDALAPDGGGGTVTPTPTATQTPGPSPTPTVTNTPGPSPTPTATVTPDPNNALRNSSFENGWETIAFGNQRPNDWQISWVEPGQPLYDAPDLATGICECVHKLDWQLPPQERPGGSDPLILDGTVTYKIFSASQAFGTTLSQTVSGLTPGVQMRLSVPLRMHHYAEPDPFGAEASVWVDGQGDWSNVEDMGDRRWCKHEISFTVPQDGSVKIDVRVKNKYPKTRDFFMDDWRLTLASEPVAHPDLPLCDPTPELQSFRSYPRFGRMAK